MDGRVDAASNMRARAPVEEVAPLDESSTTRDQAPVSPADPRRTMRDSIYNT